MTSSLELVRTQGKAMGHGWYNHLFYSPLLKKGIVKRLHGDEPWWPTSNEPHNLGSLLSDIMRDGRKKDELEKEWHAVCFDETPDFNERRTIGWNRDGFLFTV